MWHGYEKKKYKLGVGHFHEKSFTKWAITYEAVQVRRIEREGLGFEKIQKNKKKNTKASFWSE